MSYQGSLFEPRTPAESWDEEESRHALDELFNSARRYRSTNSYQRLMAFIARFPFYSPYNSMLLHLQMSGATFVATARRWQEEYGRVLKPTARPLVILRPGGPVMFVFDVADTEPLPGAKPLPAETEKPFEGANGDLKFLYEDTIDSAKRDGVRIHEAKEGSQSAGSIHVVQTKGLPPLLFQTGVDKERKPTYVGVPVRYDLLINDSLSRQAKYATVVHELAHLYCGHLGTPNEKWWPNRSGLREEAAEFEAESVCHIVCKRAGLEHSSAAYLSGYFGRFDEIPPISIECVMKAAGLIEQMGDTRLKPRA